MLLLRIFGAMSLVVASLGSGVGQSQQREKVSEGQYQKYREGKLTREGNQSWILWRMPDGRYELEDHFYLGNAAAELAAAMGSQHLSPQLRERMAGQTAQTGVDVKLSADFKVESLTVRGTRVLDGKAVELERCLIAGHEIKCKGESGSAKLNNYEPPGFFYSFPFPMLSVGLIQRAASGVGVPVPLKLAVMDLVPFDHPRVKLSRCRALLTLVGEEQIQLGERSYATNKYILEVDSEGGPLELTFWLNERLVVAMSEEKLQGERLQLIEYKKFSDF